jgi:hypothetical protein
MSEPIITKQMLIDAKAFRDQIDLFEKTFGDSVVVTVERAEKVAIMFDWDCAARLLDATARAEYWRVKATALAERKRVKAPAWREYDHVTATAWALAFIDMHKRGASK